MTTRMTGDQRKRQLLDVSLEIFGERGYYASSMDDIAQEAGITKPVVYQHFKNKESLYTELLEDVGNQLLAEIGAAVVVPQDVLGKTRAGLLAFFTFARRNPAGFKMLFNPPTAEHPGFIESRNNILEQLTQGIVDNFTDGFSPFQKQLVARGLIGQAEWTARKAIIDAPQDVDIAGVADIATSLAFGGLKDLRKS